MKTLLFTLFLAIVFAVQVFTQSTSKAKVVGVVSGDTITILTKDHRQLTINLAGIDAPEKDQDFGENAKRFLSSLVIGKNVSVVSINSCPDRLLAKVLLNGKDLSLLMVENGLAWTETNCPVYRDSVDFKELELTKNKVKEKTIGLWSQPSPIKPSEFAKLKESQLAAFNAHPSPEKQRIIISVPSNLYSIGTGTYFIADPMKNSYLQRRIYSLYNPVDFYDLENSNDSYKPVRVREYYRQDGTRVRSHTRRLPRRYNF